MLIRLFAVVKALATGYCRETAKTPLFDIAYTAAGADEEIPRRRKRL